MTLNSFRTLFLGSVLILFSCNKEKSQRWMVANITVMDYYTNEPIPFRAEMTYYDNLDLGQAYSTTEEIGNSDTEGNLKIEKRITRRSSDYSLKLFQISGSANIYFTSNPYGPFPIYQMNLKEKEKNTKFIYLKPYRFFKLHIHNINCSATDSLWISSNSTFTNNAYTGCQDTIYSGANGYYSLTQEPSVVIHVKSKKNGVVLTTNQIFDLQPGNNIINLEY